MTHLQQKIIKVYEEHLKHPSLSYIAGQAKCSKKYAHEVIQAYKKATNAKGSK